MPPEIGPEGLSYHQSLDEPTRVLLDDFREACSEQGIEVTAAELNELGLFQTFIASHVRPHAAGETPCMLLWVEWVRFCLKQTSRIPKIILEKECRDLVVNQFDAGVAKDDARGLVYPGIRFVTGRSHAVHVPDGSMARA